MIDQGLYQRLTADAGVSALVATRVYPQLLPQDPGLPALTYRLVSGPRDETHDGPSDLTLARFEVRCWVSRKPNEGGYRQARSLAAKVTAALDGFRGLLPEGTEVFRAWKANEIDGGFDPDPETTSVILEFELDYREA
jgi:hypothetical protein